MESALISTSALTGQLKNSALKVLDASYFSPNIQRDSYQEFMAQHITGAQFFDINEISDASHLMPHMLCGAEQFSDMVGRLGISNHDTVVVYDSQGLFSAPRAWWMFRTMGFDNVFVLDGGLVKWLAEGRPVESQIIPVVPARFEAGFRPHLVRNLAQITANIESRQEQLIDARSAGRFNGSEPEAWPGRKCGHVPGSINIPYNTLLTPEKTLRPKAELAEAFSPLNLDKPVVAMCGSGVSACVLALGLYELGYPDVAIYDGSWAEWGLNESTHPVELGSLS